VSAIGRRPQRLPPWRRLPLLLRMLLLRLLRLLLRMLLSLLRLSLLLSLLLLLLLLLPLPPLRLLLPLPLQQLILRLLLLLYVRLLALGGAGVGVIIRPLRPVLVPESDRLPRPRRRHHLVHLQQGTTQQASKAVSRAKVPSTKHNGSLTNYTLLITRRPAGYAYRCPDNARICLSVSRQRKRSFCRV